jgi:hypothetical protein
MSVGRSIVSVIVGYLNSEQSAVILKRFEEPLRFASRITSIGRPIRAAALANESAISSNGLKWFVFIQIARAFLKFKMPLIKFA